jgi:hypothetical protein
MGKQMHKGHYGHYSGNYKFSHDHAHTKVTKENYKASERDDAAHIDYLKRDIIYDDHHGHSDEKMTADEKHISKLAGDMKYDKEHHGSAAKHINKFMDENHQHNKNHDERPMHSHKNYEPKKKAATKMSALPAHGDEFREKAKAASKGEQGDYNYDDPKVVALLDKAKKADAEHQKEQPDAATKMSALHVEGGKAAHASLGSIKKYQEHIRVQQHHTDPSAPRGEQDPTNPDNPQYRKPKKGQQNK